jgi:hypothetical protein
MNIPEELLMRGLQWCDMHDNGKMMRIWDEQQNLGILLEFERFEMSYHFWDANGACFSPSRPFIDLDEMFAEFDKLILIYYSDTDPAAFDAYFADWKPLESLAA